MGINYLKGHKWSEITREERYFCAHLFFLIRNDLRRFLDWFKIHHYQEMNLDKKWEIGYEVCFYRDFIYKFKPGNKTIGKTDYSPKRTFDLALFADDEMIIFEAKGKGDFMTSQVNHLLIDKGSIDSGKSIKSLIDQDIRIYIFAIAPSQYFENSDTFNSAWWNSSYFDGKISWFELANQYQDDVLSRAENIKI